MKLGERIVAWRKAKRFTQRKLADAVGVGASAVCQWETGRAQPQSNNVDKIAKAFGVDLSAFYGAVPKPQKVA